MGVNGGKWGNVSLPSLTSFFCGGSMGVMMVMFTPVHIYRPWQPW